MHLRSFQLALAVTSVFATSAAAQEDRCSDILRDGVFDFTQVTNDRDYLRAWNIYSRTTSLSDASRRSGTSASGSDGLRSGGFATSDEEARRQFNESITRNQGSESELSRMAQIARIASGAITRAWAECMRGPGLTLSIRRSFDTNQFWIVAQYVSADANRPIARVAVVPDTSSLSCQPDAVNVAATEVAISCRRAQNEAVSLHVDTFGFVLRSGLVATYSIPPTPPPAEFDVRVPEPCRERIVGVYQCRGTCGGGPTAEARIDHNQGQSLFYNEIGQRVQEGFWSTDERRISLPAWGNGEVNAECNTVSWGTGAVWVRKSGPDWPRPRR